MNLSETPDAALARLLTELEAHRLEGGQERIDHHRNLLPEVEALLRRVPLVHGINGFPAFAGALRDRVLRSRTDLARDPHKAEDYFGLHDVVYTAAGVLYTRQTLRLRPVAEVRGQP